MYRKQQRNISWSGAHKKPRPDDTKTTRRVRLSGADFRKRDPNLAGQLRILQLNVRGSENLRQLEVQKLINNNKVRVIFATSVLSCNNSTFGKFK